MSTSKLSSIKSMIVLVQVVKKKKVEKKEKILFCL